MLHRWQIAKLPLLTPNTKERQTVRRKEAVIRPLTALLSLYLFFSCPMLASQENRAKPLTNADILDLLKAGVSQDVVIGKIRKSECNFDTSPAALKALKSANIPDAVTLAMVEASGEPHSDNASAPLKGDDGGIPARVSCNYADPVPVFSAPRDQSNSVEAFKVKCGDRVSVIEPIKNAGWLEIRTVDGRVGYISWSILSMKASSEPDTQNANNKRDQAQRASDDLEDCRTRAQNEYDTKMATVNTLTLTPVQRVYASNRLKQNFDAEARACRSQYEARMKAIDAE